MIRPMALRQLKLLHPLDTRVMIDEMKSLPPSSSYAGFLYEGFAVKQLASGESFPGFVSMRVEKDKTTFTVPTILNTIVTPLT